MSTIEKRGKWLTYCTIALALMGAVCNLFAEMNSSDMAKIHDDMVAAFQFEPSSIRQYLFLGLCGVVTFACTSYNRCLRSGLVHEGELVRSIGIVLGIVSPFARLSKPVTVSEELIAFYERLDTHHWQAGLTWPPEPQYVVDMAQAEFEALKMIAKTSAEHQRLMDAFLDYEFSGDPFTD